MPDVIPGVCRESVIDHRQASFMAGIGDEESHLRDRVDDDARPGSRRGPRSGGPNLLELHQDAPSIRPWGGEVEEGSEVRDGYGRPRVSRRIYLANSQLDANNDGVACER